MDLSDIDWPEFGLQDDVRPLLKALIQAGQPAVMATLVAAEGGSPRGLGAQMLFGPSDVTGYLSGGCVEADVALHAEQVMADGLCKRLIYGVGGPADVRLPCGGSIELLLERLGPGDEAARRLIQAWDARTPALWLTDGEQRACLWPGEAAGALPATLRTAERLAGEGGVCGFTRSPQVMFRRFDPSQRLVVIGADPPALAMASLGAQIGLRTTLVRPKGPLARPPAPGVDYLRSAPAEALAEVGLDPWTAVAVATHDAELDEEALSAALSSDAGYVGVLGSRRRLPERLDGLRRRGVSEAQLARLKAPIGLPLAGKSPWEIAVSVIGEVIQTVRAREEADRWPAAVGSELHALVFAAGWGARFGGGKLSAGWGDGTVLEGALRAAFASPSAAVTLVTGAYADDVASIARSFAAGRPDEHRLRIVHAPEHARGLSASIRAGIAALPDSAGAALLFLGDMPRTPHEVVAPLIEALAAGASAAAPRFKGRRGHPVAISRSLFPAMMSLEGDRGAGALLDTLGPALVLVDTEDGGVCFDVDRPGDLVEGAVSAA